MYIYARQVCGFVSHKLTQHIKTSSLKNIERDDLCTVGARRPFQTLLLYMFHILMFCFLTTFIFIYVIHYDITCIVVPKNISVSLR